MVLLVALLVLEALPRAVSSTPAAVMLEALLLALLGLDTVYSR
jgi:hypothetical protein